MTILEEVRKAREEELNKLQEEMQKTLEKIKEVFVKEQGEDIYSKKICCEVIWKGNKLLLWNKNQEKCCLIEETNNVNKRKYILEVLKKKLEEEGLKVEQITSERLKMFILL